MIERPSTAFPSTKAHRKIKTQSFASVEQEISDSLRVTVPDLSAALIREYLVSKGYRKTLEAFGTEEVRKETRISSRAELLKLLGIGKLLITNNQSKNPQKSFLEVIVHFLSTKSIKEESMEYAREENASAGNGRDINNYKIPTGWGDASTRKYVDTGDTPPILGAFRNENPKAVSRPKTAFEASTRSTTPKKQLNDDFKVVDYNEQDSDSDSPILYEKPKHALWAISKGIPMTPFLYQQLQNLLFSGKGRQSNFSEEWLGKGFVFRNSDAARYGLVQVKGGPCGLLAAVQAFILKNLIQYDKAVGFTHLRPTENQCRKALIDSISEILAKASNKSKKMYLIVKSSIPGSKGVGGLPPLEIHEFESLDTLKDFLEATITQFMVNSNNGLIQFLLSLILSRGIENILNDMDEPDCKLIGKHNYCTQEMVNLIILGEAISNVHDNDINLAGEGEIEKILKGVKSKSLFGQLSLFEHYQNIKVRVFASGIKIQIGDNLKNPIYPIWIVCSESHYTVVYSMSMDIQKNSKKSFDLFYYDGLANQEEEIRLTVSKSTLKIKEDSQYPLELCLRTKWNGCKIDWNGTDPLL